MDRLIPEFCEGFNGKLGQGISSYFFLIFEAFQSGTRLMVVPENLNLTQLITMKNEESHNSLKF